MLDFQFAGLPLHVLLVHVMAAPLMLGILVVWHVALVRRRGVVPPIDPGPRA